MTRANPLDLGKKAELLIQALAECSAEPDRLVRLYLTPEHRKAADRVASWMEDAGMAVSEDALGTVRGRYMPEGADKVLLCGSHIDTVIDAGRYDGPFGVIAGILAVDEIRKRGIALPFGIEILAFGDEEGVRFPTTLAASSAVAGRFSERNLDLADEDGISIRDALVQYGADPSCLSGCAHAPEDVVAYLEVHIEQGPVLEAEGLPVGVVTSIAGQARHSIIVRGTAGHAGTVPMTLRSDALVAASELILQIEAIAKANAEHSMVATIGRLTVAPGASNVIPNEVVFTLDLRAASDPPRLQATEAIIEAGRRIGEARGVEIALEQYHYGQTTPCAATIQEHVARAIGNLGVKPFRLASGAGHDAQAMAHIADIGMIFVRCRDGVSHNPLEHATMEDMGIAIEALIGTIVNLAAEYGDRS